MARLARTPGIFGPAPSTCSFFSSLRERKLAMLIVLDVVDDNPAVVQPFLKPAMQRLRVPMDDVAGAGGGTAD